MAFKRSQNYNVPMLLLIPTYTNSKGQNKKTYPELKDGILIYGTFRTFGGTGTEQNGIRTLLDTGKIETWFRPEIKAECRIYLTDSEEMYEIDGKPEDIDKKHMTMLMSVKRVGGKS
ncbi:MAG: hypothetical protein J5684_04620 [Eubacterium sp.]|nr:hypothetical protein [Eubacterium sp.]